MNARTAAIVSLNLAFLLLNELCLTRKNKTFGPLDVY